MRITFTENAWADYTYWKKENRKISKRIDALIGDICREPFDGLGKPEALKYDLSGFWSRRIDDEHRLIYTVVEDDVLILACRYHY
ncbi:MAG: Txe/YoeB family addiction module toxin [Firmicutes bacterium]|nr:Txe/YoeB family addiction module toxin [Bacillota bacterium]